MSALEKYQQTESCNGFEEILTDWFNGLGNESKMASVLLIELIACENELKSSLGQDIFDKFSGEVVIAEDLPIFIKGIYNTLKMIDRRY